MSQYSIALGRILSQWSKYDVSDFDIYFNLAVTGSGWSEAGIETIVIAYVDTLSNGANIVASDLTALLVADSTIDTVDILQFSRQPHALWTANPPETVSLKVFIMEQPSTDAAKITVPVQVPIWVEVQPSYGSSESSIESAVLAYFASLVMGQTADYSDLDDIITLIDATYAGYVWEDTTPPASVLDIVPGASELLVTDAAKVTFISP